MREEYEEKLNRLRVLHNELSEIHSKLSMVLFLRGGNLFKLGEYEELNNQLWEKIDELDTIQKSILQQ